MQDEDIGLALRELRRLARGWRTTTLETVREETGDPFRLLVSCVISLRTRDAVTEEASRRLFSIARTPRALASLPARSIERAIYPASFYRVKARTLRRLSREILARFGGRVPGDLDSLLSLHGVGRKTANLVVTLGFGKPGICVDTHVHRVSNRWGYVRTRTPEQTEAALRVKLPRRYWIEFNDLLVSFGQNLCTPLSPWCGRCPVRRLCARAGVGRSR